MASPTSPIGNLPGLDQARRILTFHNDRMRVYNTMCENLWMFDSRIAAVHVESSPRADRLALTGYNEAGEPIAGDMFYPDEPFDDLVIVPNFDSDAVGFVVPADSSLAKHIERVHGWIIHMDTLRAYDPDHDRKDTRRSAFLALLSDMIAMGEAQSFCDPDE